VKNYKIKKLSEVKKEKLIEFYLKVFKNRDERLINNFDWCYRVGYKNLEPIIVEIDNKIIGHAGLIPVELKVNGENKLAIWFTDFAILPEFQGKGYGKILTKEWMKICPLQITFCNKYSLKIFKKFEWKENFNFHRTIIPINYFKFIPIIRDFNIFNLNKKIQGLFIKKIYDHSKFKEISTVEKKISHLVSLENKKNINEKTHVIRNEDWFEWRLIKCPYKANLHFFEYESDVLIANIFKKKNLKIMNLIYFSSYNNIELFRLLKLWCLQNDIDYIWSMENKKFSSNKNYSFFLKKRTNFAFYSDDNSINNFFKSDINFQAIDSDSDFNYL